MISDEDENENKNDGEFTFGFGDEGEKYKKMQDEWVNPYAVKYKDNRVCIIPGRVFWRPLDNGSFCEADGKCQEKTY